MKILVPVKRVVDHNVKIRVKPDGSGVELGNVKMAMNPFDEIALEAALRLKEAGHATEVLLVSIGTDEAAETLRAGLSLGADRGLFVKTDVRLEPLAVAKLLKTVADVEGPGLVIMGKQAIDDDCNQTGQMLAALLGWSQGTFVSKIELGKAPGENMITVGREVDGGIETLALTLPAVVTVDLRLNAPRYPTLPNIMKAKKKAIETRDAAEFGIDIAPRLNILETLAPSARKAGIKVASAAELVNRLKSEARVI
ncbi:MAG TPA: electron transfer flavoprotein subunit beta/FixA family protein [Methylovirgula sp.]|jgi:electron transfer flavoprotein beta subunit|nr:electron transfer flavoprotein subunit beta/FixA family protein [Methylovirgula sp.]